MAPTAVLRKALQARLKAGAKLYPICQELGIPQPTVYLWLRGKGELKGSQVDKLAGWLGLELRPRKR